MQDDNINFYDVDDLLQHVGRGCEVEFEYNGRTYWITRSRKKGFIVYEADIVESTKQYKNPAAALEYKCNGKRLGDIISDIKIVSRTF